jgi:hypothetical protein
VPLPLPLALPLRLPLPLPLTLPLAELPEDFLLSSVCELGMPPTAAPPSTDALPLAAQPAESDATPNRAAITYGLSLLFMLCTPFMTVRCSSRAIIEIQKSGEQIRQDHQKRNYSVLGSKQVDVKSLTA